MTTKDKLVDRFCKLPRDFTFEEVMKLLSVFGYKIHNKGATSGSRIRFKNEGMDDENNISTFEK